MTTTTVRFVLLVVFVFSAILLGACGDNDPVAVDVQTVAGETSQSMSDTDLVQAGCPTGYHVTKSGKCRNNDPFQTTDVIPMP